MADAWHALQSAIRALRKEGDIRRRLVEAYRELAKLRAKDLPSEVRADHEWLHTHLHPHAVESILSDIRITVAQLSEAQLSEAVNRIITLYSAVEQYQPSIASTSSKRAACSTSKGRDHDRATQLDLWESELRPFSLPVLTLYRALSILTGQDNRKRLIIAVREADAPLARAILGEEFNLVFCHTLEDAFATIKNRWPR